MVNNRRSRPVGHLWRQQRRQLCLHRRVAASRHLRRVICCLFSFVQMPDGNPYPTLIPETLHKPLRFFLQAAHRDLHWEEDEPWDT